MIESTEACALFDGAAVSAGAGGTPAAAFALQISANIFLARLGNIKGLHAKKFGNGVFGISIFKPTELRHGEAPRRRSHPPMAPAAGRWIAAPALTMTAGRLLD
jgi:hypothetical protein